MQGRDGRKSDASTSGAELSNKRGEGGKKGFQLVIGGKRNVVTLEQAELVIRRKKK